MTSAEGGDGDGRRRVAEVEDDVTRQFAPYFERAEDAPGFSLDPGFGDEGVVTGQSTTAGFTFVRWRWQGRHTGGVRRFDGEQQDDRDRPYFMAQGTGNHVTVEGLTVLEERGDGIYARRFVDWLSVYSQMGIITPGRPVARTGTELHDPPPRDELPEPLDRQPDPERPPHVKTRPSAS